MRVTAPDEVNLSVIEAGRGEPIVFVHEFSGDARSWQPQFAYFGRSYRAIAFNARGYPPSDVPSNGSAYSQTQAAEDIAAVLRSLDTGPAHIVGLSMGGYAALHLGLRDPQLARSLTIAGCGYGSKPQPQPDLAQMMADEATHALSIGMVTLAKEYAVSAYAQCLRGKDEAGWRLFAAQLAEHSIEGTAHTLREILGKRPGLWQLEAGLRDLALPTLLVIGDEDGPCVEPNLFLKRTIPDAALCILPRTGHLLNLEEPALFNAIVGSFIAAVGAGSWRAWRQPLRTQT